MVRTKRLIFASFFTAGIATQAFSQHCMHIYSTGTISNGNEIREQLEWQFLIQPNPASQWSYFCGFIYRHEAWLSWGSYLMYGDHKPFNDTTQEVHLIDVSTPDLPTATRQAGDCSKINIRSKDNATFYGFHLFLRNIYSYTIFCHSDTVNYAIKSGLKGFYVSEDNNIDGFPDTSIASVNTIFIPAIDSQEVVYTVSDLAKYVHIVAVDNAGNMGYLEDDGGDTYISCVVTVPPVMVVDTIVDNVNFGEVYTQNGFSLPAQNVSGLHTYSRTNGCDSTWVLQLNVLPPPIEICAGDSVVLGANFTWGGDTAKFQWFKNGQIVAGARDSIFTYFPSVGRDTVLCRLVSNENCAEPDTMFSSKVIITTIPVLVASVSISEDYNNICADIPVTFTASTLVNGGTSPAYQWVKNGIDIPFATSSTYTYTPKNGDIITCKMISSEVCATPKPAISNPITMIIKPIRKPSIAIKRIK